MTIGGKGMSDVEAGETNGGGATLDNADVANCGIVQVENGAILDLKGVTIAGACSIPSASPTATAARSMFSGATVRASSTARPTP